MRALVVYESMYGNTERIAVAIAEGLGPDAVAVEVGAAPRDLPPEVDLLVVGGPTHGHGMSQPATRENASGHADRPVVSPGEGIREWIAGLRADRAVRFTAFDTRIKGPKLLWGSAAESAAKALSARGFQQAAPPASFLVGGPLGSPYDRLVAGELDRARELGRSLAALLPALSR